MLAAAFGMTALAGMSISIDGRATLTSGFLPEAGDVRTQIIHKAKDEADWPFVADAGVLACVDVLNDPAVYFVPEKAQSTGKAFAIDTDLFAMSMVNLGTTDVLKPYASLEELLKRITPFVIMGRRLCDQPRGTNVTGSEL